MGNATDNQLSSSKMATSMKEICYLINDRVKASMYKEVLDGFQAYLLMISNQNRVHRLFIKNGLTKVHF